MKPNITFSGTVVLFSLVLVNSAPQSEIPELEGAYLGQTPPGMVPEVFAPGILNTETMGAFCSVFSPDGNEFHLVYYERKDESSGGLAWMRRIDDVWTEPEFHHFDSADFDNDMCMSADGNTLIFRSWRALPSGEKPKDHSYLWSVKRTEDGWSGAEPLLCAGAPVRTGYPSIADNGTLYFAHRRDGILGIFRSKPVDGVYGTPEHVFTAVDSIDTEGDMFVAPDESYMIISCWDHPDNIGSGQGDLYVTFRKEDGTWTEEVNMGGLVNTRFGENCPQVTPDGRYFFFNRYDPESEEGNIYWVDARIIGELKTEGFPVLEGPYLGQKPPGMDPEVFAPGIICTEGGYELNSIFSPDGDEFYYEISTTMPEEKKEGRYFYIIMVSKRVNGVWTKPEVAPFSGGEYMTVDICFSPDGNRFYFCSDRPNPWDASKNMHIWCVDRSDDGWSDPQILGPPIFSVDGNTQPSVAGDGTMYFRSGDDLFYSRYVNGRYSKPVILGEAINTQYAESKPFVAPDESCLLFNRYEMPDSIDGGRGLYISFKRDDGSWTQAKNTNIKGGIAKVTPDGKYLFFSRGGDIYWVDVGIIDDLKPDNLN
jgi:hypothetical protein